jgi:hypothetical protein
MEGNVLGGKLAIEIGARDIASLQSQSFLPVANRVGAICDAPSGSIAHRSRILEQSSLACFEWWRFPCRPSSSHLFIRDIHFKRVGYGVDGDDVAVLYKGDRSTDLGFGDYVTDHETVGSSS